MNKRSRVTCRIGPDPPAFRCLGTPPPVASTPVAPPFAPCLRGASPLEPDQARRISAAGDRVARPCVRGSRTGSEGSETAAEGPLRWRLGSRRGRIGRGSRRAWARCQDVGRIGGGRPGRPRGRRGGWVAPRGRRRFGTPRAGRAGVSECYTGARFASVASRGSPPGG